MSDETKVREKPHGVARLLGLERVVDNGAQSGRAILHFRAIMDMCHSGGVVQGGFVTGWLDMAMANVVLSKTNYEQNLLSLEIKVSFLASAGPGLIIAEAWIERMGRSTGFLEARLTNEGGDLLAKASSTVKLVSMRRG